MKRHFDITCLVLLLALLISTSAQQQERQQTSPAIPQNAQPYGNVEVGDYESWDDGEGGAIYLTVMTPGDQHPNINLVGPDGYWQHFEVEDAAGGERGIGELRPGVYSIAASDERLQLVETKVEVREGQAVRVHLELQPMPDAALDTAAYPAYPSGSYRYGPYTPYANTEQGSFSLNSDNENILFVVTGPNGYSEDFRGSFTADPLVPGVYSIAATGEGENLSETKVEVQRARALPVLVAIPHDAQTGGAGQTQAGTQTGGTMTGGTMTGGAGQQQTGSRATAQLQDADGNTVGNATLTTVQNGVIQVQVQLNNLSAAAQGEHGIHIHQVGQCEPPSFESAGNHFNLANAHHGFLSLNGPHAGDLPNIRVDGSGNASYEATTTLVTLGQEQRSLFDDDGSALVIHTNPDDYITDPSGNSGDPIACGVITQAQQEGQ